MRIFIAIDTPESIKQEIETIQQKLKSAGADVRWESQNKFHITIKFLGDTKEELLPKIYEIIKNISTKIYTFPLIYRNLGCFPNKRQPRVIWIGCEDVTSSLTKLKMELDVNLKSLGFEIEDREFHPHITLGRVKSQTGIKNLIPIIESLIFESRITECREILIVRSVLKSSGSDYTILKSINLNSKKK